MSSAECVSIGDSHLACTGAAGAAQAVKAQEVEERAEQMAQEAEKQVSASAQRHHSYAGRRCAFSSELLQARIAQQAASKAAAEAGSRNRRHRLRGTRWQWFGNACRRHSWLSCRQLWLLLQWGPPRLSWCAARRPGAEELEERLRSARAQVQFRRRWWVEFVASLPHRLSSRWSPGGPDQRL